MNPLETPLLVYGNCRPDDFPEYERCFNDTYRRGPVYDRFGRRVTFMLDRAEHVCNANPRHRQGDDKTRSVWRPDRAQRIPWIQVALTHKTSVLKENKEPGKQSYLVAMQVLEPSRLTRDYYQVVVERRKDGTEVKFLTAYPLDDHQWRDAMRMKSVRVNLLQLMSSVKDTSCIPAAGKELIVVAALGGVLHFRRFDSHGKVVVDTDETELTEQAPQIEALKKQLESLWPRPSHLLTGSKKGQVISAVKSIVGSTGCGQTKKAGDVSPPPRRLT